MGGGPHLLKSPVMKTGPFVVTASKRALVSKSEAPSRRWWSDQWSRWVFKTVNVLGVTVVEMENRATVQTRKQPAPGNFEGSKGVLLGGEKVIILLSQPIRAEGCSDHTYDSQKESLAKS